MNDDEERAEKSVTEPKRGLFDLPPEVMARVVKHFATLDLNETARNFNSFRRVNQTANTFIKETPATERFVGRVKRLGELEKVIYDAAIPKGALHEESAEEPGGTHGHVAIGAAVQGSRPPAERAELVAKVSDLSDRFGVRAEASVPLIASEHTDPQDRNNLIEDAIRSYNRNRKGYSWASNDELRESALYALKEAHERNHLTEQQIAKLAPGTLDRQKPNVFGIGSRPNFIGGQEFKERLSGELNAAHEGVKIDRKIDKLSNEFLSLSNNLPDLQDHSIDADNNRSREFEKLEIVAKHASESYAEALDLYMKDDPQRPSGDAGARAIYDERSRHGQGRGE
ncbi:hypothetical protein [Mesorhizobium sp. GbtcB19]|uniref:hypothetical protein n=1 Tax=Mesorhizobium sp. GbtcB19 TaxID=2824764 RepID=UPI001C2F9CD9|nr:hypothetical protein [Mesorhizobium sp. GbtcB19]